MFDRLIKFLGAFLLTVFLTASAVHASGKMEVRLGDKVVLQSETVGGDYKWVATKGKEIISTQTGSIFNYTFDRQGEYKVNLTVTETSGATRDTVVTVLVGDRFSRVSPTSEGEGEGTIGGAAPRARVSTLPTISSDQSVRLLGDEGRVVFDITPRDDILEYRIDRNIFVDSDGDGIANNDIDNSDHSSYLLGGVWQTKYLASESNQIAAEITVVSQSGETAKTQVQIIFDSLPSKEGNVVAVMDTLPLTDPSDKKVYIYGDQQIVAFYARRSQGDIVEYRLDKNIFVDSDGDGNPSNDIDNKQDASFKNGDVWTTVYEKSGQQIIAQLIVVGRGGTGSRIQREITFSDEPAPVFEEVVPEEETGIRLTVDKEFVQKGDPVVFSVQGLTQSLDRYVFEWDFNGDDVPDQTVEGDNTVTYIYDTAAVYPVKVKVADLDGNEGSFSLDLLVKDVAETEADFEYETEGATVQFTNASQASENLTNRVLSYTWNFGDTDPENYASQTDQIGLENPTYTYSAPGTYLVTLTVVDSDQVTDTFTSEVTLDESAFAPQAAEEEGAPEEAVSGGGGGLFGTILKWILYIILVVIVLVVVIVVGLLAFLKIQNPDLVFEELIDELKIKLLGMLGVHEMIEHEPKEGPAVSDEGLPRPPSGGAVPKERPEKAPEKAPEEAPEEPVAAKLGPEEAEKEAPAESDLSKQDAPVPEWLKGTKPAEVPKPKKEVIEGEVEEEIPAQPEPPAEPEPPAKPAPQEPKAEPAPEPPKAKPAPETPAKPQIPKAPEKPTSDDKNQGENEGPVPDWLKNA